MADCDPQILRSHSEIHFQGIITPDRYARFMSCTQYMSTSVRTPQQ